MYMYWLHSVDDAPHLQYDLPSVLCVVSFTVMKQLQLEVGGNYGQQTGTNLWMASSGLVALVHL